MLDAAAGYAEEPDGPDFQENPEDLDDTEPDSSRLLKGSAIMNMFCLPNYVSMVSMNEPFPGSFSVSLYLCVFLRNRTCACVRVYLCLS